VRRSAASGIEVAAGQWEAEFPDSAGVIS